MLENNHSQEMNVLSDHLEYLFMGLVGNMVFYSRENLHGANIWDVYSAIVIDFTTAVMFDEEVTEEDLQTLSKDLVLFGNKYKVNEVGPIIEEIKHIIDNKLYKRTIL